MEPEKTPSQLDHAAPDASIAGTRKTFLAPAAAALVRRAGKASMAGDGPAIAQVTGEDLVDQHVGRLDAKAAAYDLIKLPRLIGAAALLDGTANSQTPKTLQSKPAFPSTEEVKP